LIKLICNVNGGEKMANIKSAKKRVKTTAKKTLSNAPVRTKMKSAVKKMEKAPAEKKGSMLKKTIKSIDKALKKGLIKKNTAARKKSRLTKKANVK
jgi:small subunit ribosomal protein S20